MKCKYCNASVTLQDEYCPYCGALNEAARKHIDDMRRYGRAFEQTKAEVYASADRQSKTHGMIIALIVLIILNLFMLIAQIAADSVADAIKEKQIHKHMAAYEAQLFEYEMAGHYDDLVELYDKLMLDANYKDFHEFSLVADMARSHAYIRDAIYYLTQEDVSTYWSKGELMERIANHTIQLYGSMNSNSSFYEDCLTEPHLSAMADLESQTRELLMGECGLLEDDFETIADMSKQELMMLIGRRMGIYE